MNEHKLQVSNANLYILDIEHTNLLKTGIQLFVYIFTVNQKDKIPIINTFICIT